LETEQDWHRRIWFVKCVLRRSGIAKPDLRNRACARKDDHKPGISMQTPCAFRHLADSCVPYPDITGYDLPGSAISSSLIFVRSETGERFVGGRRSGRTWEGADE
jgi:hypothetical protein